MLGGVLLLSLGCGSSGSGGIFCNKTHSWPNVTNETCKKYMDDYFCNDLKWDGNKCELKECCK
jgi:hypothetical protein